MPAGPRLDLETLVVHIVTNHAPYLEGMREVQATFVRAQTQVQQLSRMVLAAGGDMVMLAQASRAAAAGVAAVGAAGQGLTGLTTTGAGLTTLATSISAVGNAAASMPQLEAQVRGIAEMHRLLVAFGGALPTIRQDFTNLSGISGVITRFAGRVEDWETAIGGLTNRISRRIGGFARRIDVWMPQFQRLDEISAVMQRMAAATQGLAPIGAVAAGITQLTTAVAGADLRRLDDIGVSLNAFGRRMGQVGFQTLLTANLANLQQLGPALQGLSQSLVGVRLSRLPDLGTQLNAFGANLSRAAIGNIARASHHLAALGTSLGAAPQIDANLTMLANSLAAFGSRTLGNANVMTLLNNPATLAGLPALGQHIAAFNTSIGTITPQNLRAAAAVMTAAGSASIPKNLAQNAQLFTTHLPGIATSLTGFYTSLTGLNPDVLNAVTGGLRQLGSAATVRMLQNAQLYATNLPMIGSGIATFAQQLASVNPANLLAVTNALNAAAAANNAMRSSVATRAPVSMAPPLLPRSLTGGAMHNLGFAVGAGERFAFEFQLLRYSLLGVGIASTIAFARFDDAITRSLAVVRNATPQMRAELEATIRSLVSSGRSVTSPTELARGTQFLLQSGMSFQETIQNLRLVDQLALVSAMDIQRTADALTTLRTTFGLSTGDLERVSDVMVRGAQLGRQSVQQMAEALQTVGPTARRLNLSLEETTAILAAMGQQGIVGGQAAAHLGRLLNTLATAATRNREAWQNFGLGRAVFENGQLRPLGDIMQSIYQRQQGMTDAQIRSMEMQLGLAEAGGTGLSRTMGALRGASGTLREFTAELMRVRGITKEVADQQLFSFGNQMVVLWNNLKLLFTDVGKVLAPTLLIIAGVVRGLVAFFNAIPQPIKAIAAALLPVVLGMFAFDRVASMLVRHGGLFRFLAEQVRGLAFSFGLFAAGTTSLFWIVGLTAALAGLAMTTEAGRAAFVDMRGSLASVGDSLGVAFAAFAQMLPPLVSILATVAVPVFQLLAVVLRIVAIVLETVAGHLQRMPSWLKSLLGWIIAIVVAGRLLSGVLLMLRAQLALLTVQSVTAWLGLMVTAFQGWAVWAGRALIPTTLLLLKVLAIVAILDTINTMLGGESFVDRIMDNSLGPGVQPQWLAGSNRPSTPMYRPLTIAEQLMGFERPSLEELHRPAASFGQLAAQAVGIQTTWAGLASLAMRPAMSGAAQQAQLASLGPVRGGTYEQLSNQRLIFEGPGGLSRGTTARTGAFEVADHRTHQLLEEMGDNPAVGH